MYISCINIICINIKTNVIIQERDKFKTLEFIEYSILSVSCLRIHQLLKRVKIKKEADFKSLNIY